MCIRDSSASAIAKKPFGHDLVSLLQRVVTHRSDVAALPPNQLSAIELLAKDYRSAQLTYIEVGHKYYLPRLDLIEEAARSLLQLVQNNLRSKASHE